MQEVWKDVVGFEEYFKVSKFGSLYSKRSGKILRQYVSKEGYLTVATKIGGRGGTNHCIKIHRAVAEAFLDAPSDDLVSMCNSQGYGNVIVRHLNGDKTDNAASNLAWGTYKDNSADFMLAPNFAASVAKRSGSNNLNAGLSEDQVKEIRGRYKPRCKVNGARALANVYNVHHTNISRVCRGASYK
jgi:hypothetical protein